jgi:dTDP-4-dehydrorhamnose reductase
MNILLVGCNGFLGTNILLYKKKKIKFICLYNKKKTKYLNKFPLFKYNKKNLVHISKKFKINVIINSAGITNVDLCENKKELVKNTHSKLIKELASVFKKDNPIFVHISTDHLFDGKKKYYSERSKTNPINFYGKSKLESEKIVYKNFKRKIIIRGNFFGWGTKYKKSFSDWIIENLYKNKILSLFEDIYFTPLNIERFIEIIFKLIKNKSEGIYNLSSNTRISKYEFGIKIAKRFGLKVDQINKAFIKNSKLTQRPKNMSLNNKKIIRKLKLNKNKLDNNDQIDLLFNQKSLNNYKILKSL